MQLFQSKSRQEKFSIDLPHNANNTLGVGGNTQEQKPHNSFFYIYIKAYQNKSACMVLSFPRTLSVFG